MSKAFDNIRSALNTEGVDAPVQVNQRALIDKILARYASAYALYRELLQNSNDASATRATIHLTTTSTKFRTPRVSETIFRNNGTPFCSADWTRLRRIADGNPDPAKVGAFGVGFYTVFSVTDAPLVVSGGNVLSFRWDGDTLVTRSVQVRETSESRAHSDIDSEGEWTTFILPARAAAPLPNFVELGEFMCASLTFTSSLCDISIFVDDKLIIRVYREKDNDSSIIPVPPTLPLAPKVSKVAQAPNKTVGLISASSQDMMLRIETATHTAVFHGTVVSGLAKVTLDSSLRAQIKRVTKKDPPARTNILLFIPDSLRNRQEEVKQSSLPADIARAFSPEDGKGHVFIGFRTSQTIGLALHIAAPLVPTVEREAVDMQDPNLVLLNTDLLFTAGEVLRLWYETAIVHLSLRLETEEAKNRAKVGSKGAFSSSPSAINEVSTPGVDKSLAKGDVSLKKNKRFWRRILSQPSKGSFTEDKMHDKREVVNENDISDHLGALWSSLAPATSTPDRRISHHIQSGFKRALMGRTPLVLTRSGLQLGANVRLAHDGIDAFITKDVVPQVLVDRCNPFLRLTAGSRNLTFHDLAVSIATEILSESKLVELLKWYLQYKSTYGTEKAISSQDLQLFRSVRFTLSVESQQAMETTIVSLRLNEIIFFRTEELWGSKTPIHTDTLPDHLQDSLGDAFEDGSFDTFFKPLPFSTWAQRMANHSCITHGSRQNSELRLEIMRHVSSELKKRSGETSRIFSEWIHKTFHNKVCIDCDDGTVQNPCDVFFPDTDIEAFRNLGKFRRVSLSIYEAGVSREFLKAAGVRSSIPPSLLFENLQELKWDGNPEPLIRYLRSASLSKEDTEILCSTKFLPGSESNKCLFSPRELFLPLPDLHSLSVVNVLKWPGEISEQSKDGQFLISLGCRILPPLSILFQRLETETDITKIEGVLSFVCMRWESDTLKGKSYLSSYPTAKNFRFLPASRMDLLTGAKSDFEMVGPAFCFEDKGLHLLGFPVLSERLTSGSRALFVQRFQVSKFPLMSQMIEHMLSQSKTCRDDAQTSNPKLSQTAVQTHFENVFNLLADCGKVISDGCKKQLIATPFIPQVCKGKLIWLRPTEVCFSSMNDKLYVRLFATVSYNRFLYELGVREIPSAESLLQKLLQSSEEILRELNVQKYLILLTRLAAFEGTLRLSSGAKNGKILLARDSSRRNSVMENFSETENGESHSDLLLSRGRDIFIVDDASMASLFPIKEAPSGWYLHNLYRLFGARVLSEAIQRNVDVHGTHRSKTLSTEKLLDHLYRRRQMIISGGVVHTRLKEDGLWIIRNRNINVVEVDKIVEIFTLDGKERSRSISCSTTLPWTKGGDCIYITQNFSWKDVGTAIGKVLFKDSGLPDALYIATILQAPLEKLREMGYRISSMEGIRDENEIAIPPDYSESIISAPGQIAKVAHSYVTEENMSLGGSGATSGTQVHYGSRHKGLWSRVMSAMHTRDGMSPEDVKRQNDVKWKYLALAPLAIFAAIPAHGFSSQSRSLSNHVSDETQKLVGSLPGCDMTHAHNLVPWTVARKHFCTKHGIQVFIEKGSSHSLSFMKKHVDSIHAFGDILKMLSGICNIPLKSIAIFHENGKTVAFFRKGGFFFNLHYFTALHYQIRSNEEISIHWLVTMCHELAHTLVLAHNREHGAITQQFIVMHMPKLFSLLSSNPRGGL